MADLVEVSEWETGIYQIEMTDPVLGGPPNIALGEGMTNVPAQQLANRTVYLLDAVAVLDTAFTALSVEIASGQFDDDLEVAGANPSVRLTETDEGSATDQARITLSDGEMFIQSEGAVIRLTGWAGADLTLLTAKFSGVDQPIVHGGMLATDAAAGIVKKATNPQALAGTEADVYADVVDMKAAIVALSGKMVEIAQWTHSVNVANVDFTDLGDYAHIYVLFDNLTTSWSVRSLLRVSNDNGVTFPAFNYVTRAGDDSTSSPDTTGIPLVDATKSYITNGHVEIVGFNIPTSKFSATGLINAGLFPFKIMGNHTYINAANALQVSGGGANFTGGTITILGVRG